MGMVPNSSINNCGNKKGNMKQYIRMILEGEERIIPYEPTTRIQTSRHWQYKQYCPSVLFFCGQKELTYCYGHPSSYVMPVFHKEFLSELNRFIENKEQILDLIALTNRCDILLNRLERKGRKEE